MSSKKNYRIVTGHQMTDEIYRRLAKLEEMGLCIVCERPHGKKRDISCTCSAKCRQQLYRNRKKASDLAEQAMKAGRRDTIHDTQAGRCNDAEGFPIEQHGRNGGAK